jgi:hypothetical protein
MTIPKLPVTSLSDEQMRRRHREVTNLVLTHQHDDSRVQTSAEKLAGVTPVNYAYPPGDIRRFGAVSGEDCVTAINTSLSVHNIAIIPENFTALISSDIEAVQAGSILRGKSRYTSIIQPSSSSFSAGRILSFPSAASSTYYGLTVSDLYFKMFSGTTNLDTIGIDLSSINNAKIHRCRFEALFKDDGTGDDDWTQYVGTGVFFSAPLNAAAYSNCVEECDFFYLENGVQYDSGANTNRVRGGEILHCKYGIHAAPVSVVDSVYIDGTRIEACETGILEGSENSLYLNIRFEDQEVADIKFTANSSNACVIGCSTSDTTTPLVDLDDAVGTPMIFSPELRGLYSRPASDSFANELLGPNVVAPRTNTGTAVVPTGVSDVALYGRGGKFVLDNNNAFHSRDAAGTGGFELIKGNSGDRVELDPAGKGLRIGGALVALGGGAAATLGTIGGSGPGTAAQNSWKLLFDSTGAAFWVPVWK